MAESQKTDAPQVKKMGRPTGAKDKKPRNAEGQKGIVHNPKGGSANFNKPDELPEGYNTESIAFMLAITPPCKPDYNDLEEMQNRFAHYLRMCQQYDKKVSNLTAYYAIGVTADAVYNFVSEKGKRANPERCEWFQKVRQFCGAYREGLMADGKVNPVTGIFWQKNYDGLRDAQEHIVVPAQPLGEIASGESLANKYLDNATIASDHQIASGDEDGNR